ncbi:hypothetical protein BGLA2_700103 [Burkholderia gladioli]|nr:hypothetical protein BGLA2_700103 [Burkholderia gladioli]
MVPAEPAFSYALMLSTRAAPRILFAAPRGVSDTMDQSWCHQAMTAAASLMERAATTSRTSSATSFHHAGPSVSLARGSIACR